MLNKFKKSKTILTAISAENIELLKKCLESGADPNKQNKSGTTPIFKALESSVYDEHVEMLQLLIEYGADVNFKNTKGETVIQDVSLPIIAEILVDNGADLSVKTKWGDSLLHIAFSFEMTEFYLNKAIDVNSINDSGSTPLYEAISSGVDVVKLLLDNGGMVDIQDNEGFTPLMCLAMSENLDDTERIEIGCIV